MAEDLAASERLRRSLETERDELQEELNSLGGNRTNLAEEKRRLEARIQQVCSQMYVICKLGQDSDLSNRRNREIRIYH